MLTLSFCFARPLLCARFARTQHLFPLVDFSYHREIQTILMEACRDHGIQYEAGNFFDIYGQMVRSFGTPLSLWKEINAYNGS